MHLDDILPNVTEMQGNTLPVGCTTIMCNQSGHVRVTINQKITDVFRQEHKIIYIKQE